LNNIGQLNNGASYALLDDASPQIPLFSHEMEKQKLIAANTGLPIEQRVEAFEDIVESEVGDTTLSRARNIEREVGIRQLFLKFEGGNPTGTQKDRIAFVQTMDALRRGFDSITVATCGNFGVALAIAASCAGLRCIVYIPEKYQTRRIKEMQKYNVEIIRVPGDYEHAVSISKQDAQEKELYDANPGGANTILQLQAYGEIAYEIYDELRDAPAVLAVPVSNGTTLAGIHKGFVSLHRRGKTSRIPRIVAGSSFHKNPIIQAYLKKMELCEDLPPLKIKETAVNEPLINWHSIDGNLALEAIRATNGWAGYATDKTMLSYSRYIREQEGLNVLPASTAGLIAFIEHSRNHPLPNDRYVIILTGRKS
jgi:threonine synthase